MIVFRYKEELAGRGQTINRPVADVALKNKLAFSLGKLIGLKTDETKIEQIGGIRGSVPVIYHACIVRIGLNQLPIKLAWALIEEVPPLLGRSEIFDYFSITFKQRQKIIIFEKP